MTRIEEAQQKFGADDNIAKLFELGIAQIIINDDAWLCLTTNEQARLLGRIARTIEDNAPILLK
jgi:hypothetical protein